MIHEKSILEQNGKVRNTMFLYAFMMSFVLLFLYSLAFLLFGRLGSSFFTVDTGSFFSVWLPPILIGTVVSLICCVPIKFMRAKIIIPLSMSFLVLYFVVILIAILSSSNLEQRALDVYIVCFYMLPCIIPGNLFSWLVYRKMPVKNRDVEMKL